MIHCPNKGSLAIIIIIVRAAQEILEQLSK